MTDSSKPQSKFKLSNVLKNNVPMSEQDFWTDFIELYRDNRCLWDKSSPNYKNKNHRKAAYTVLINEFKKIDPYADCATVRKKIDSFRSGYRRETKKLHEMQKACCHYRPSLWYYDKLTFLKSSIEERGVEEQSVAGDTAEVDQQNIVCYIENNLASIEEHGVEEQNVADDTAEVDPQNIVCYIENNLTIPDSEEVCIDTSNYLISHPLPPLQPLEPPAKMAKRTDEAVAPLNELPSPTVIEGQDECAFFCKQLSMQMRGLKTDQRNIAQKLIAEVMYMACMEQLDAESMISVEKKKRAEDASCSTVVNYLLNDDYL